MYLGSPGSVVAVDIIAYTELSGRHLRNMLVSCDFSIRSLA